MGNCQVNTGLHLFTTAQHSCKPYDEELKTTETPRKPCQTQILGLSSILRRCYTKGKIMCQKQQTRFKTSQGILKPHIIMSKMKCINKRKNACQALTHKQRHKSGGTSSLKNSVEALTKLLFYAGQIMYIMFNIFQVLSIRTMVFSHN